MRTLKLISLFLISSICALANNAANEAEDSSILSLRGLKKVVVTSTVIVDKEGKTLPVISEKEVADSVISELKALGVESYSDTDKERVDQDWDAFAKGGAPIIVFNMVLHFLDVSESDKIPFLMYTTVMEPVFSLRNPSVKSFATTYLRTFVPGVIPRGFPGLVKVVLSAHLGKVARDYRRANGIPEPKVRAQ